MWVRQPLTEEAVLDALGEPDELFKRGDCCIIKDQWKIRVGRVVLTVSGLPTPVYVKRYNAFSWRYKLMSLFCRSGALRSLKGALLLERIGVPTGRPLAALESRRWGLLSRSFYISEEIAAGQTSDRYWQDSLRPLAGVAGFKHRRRFLENLAGLFHRLHEACIYHNDLKDANILVKTDAAGGERFYLIDLEGVRDCLFLTWRRRVKNIVQLNRTLGRFLGRSEKLYWFQHYLGREFDNRSLKRRWLGQILRATLRADQRPRPKKDGQHRRRPHRRPRHKTVERF